MSGIYIKGMEMPTSCLSCEWCVHTIPADNYICYRLNRAVIGVVEEDVNETVNVCCPLIPVPDHGRLIDADAMCDGLVLNHPVVIYAECMPTVIPADKEETE